MKRTLMKGAMTAAVAVGLSAATASAQLITYSTSGVFAGCVSGNPASCIVASSTPSQGLPVSAELTYTGFAGSYFSPVVNGGADLGVFTLTTTGFGSFDFSSASFTMTISQTSPDVAGPQVVTGDITGTFTYASPGASSGGLFWTPNVSQFTLGSVRYDVVVDDFGAIGIMLPSSGAGVTNLKANLSTVPEPGTIILLGTGIAGLGLFGLRRRQNQA